MSAPPRPVLVFEGGCPRCTRAARLWWHLVSRDRYEVRPADQADAEAPGTHGFVWVDRHGQTWTGAGALSEAIAEGDRRVLGLLGDPRGRRWARVLPVLVRLLAHG